MSVIIVYNDPEHEEYARNTEEKFEKENHFSFRNMYNVYVYVCECTMHTCA